MNIFYLSESPMVSAQAMTNKHVVKMILETAQLLSTAHHVLDGENTPFKEVLYKQTHVNHPSSIWARESSENYDWLYRHFIALSHEYTLRYGKTHMTYSKLKDVLIKFPKNIPYIPKTPIRLAITNKAHHKNTPIKSYRTYYEQEKIKDHNDLKRYMTTIYGVQYEN